MIIIGFIMTLAIVVCFILHGLSEGKKGVFLFLFQLIGSLLFGCVVGYILGASGVI